MTVLRYPGGKSRAIKLLEKFLPKKIDKLYSPFFGGGSFEFHVSENYNAQIIANDKFTPLYNFWSCLQKDKNKLIAEVRKIHPIDKNKFAKYKQQLENVNAGKFKRAAYYFAINRSSFSGSTMSGGFSNASANERFNEASINRLSKIKLESIKFYNDDFTDFISSVPADGFMFLDPPYYLDKNSKLYGKRGDLHETFDHKKLFNKLKSRKNFILCYNDCKYIRKLYGKFVIVNLDWKYGMNASKKSSEIIIMPKEYVEENSIVMTDENETENSESEIEEKPIKKRK